MVPIEEIPVSSTAIRLTQLAIGERGIIVEIDDPALKLALFRLGLLQGDTIQLSQKAPFSGPIALKVRGGKVALRAADAEKVRVKRLA